MPKKFRSSSYIAVKGRAVPARRPPRMIASSVPRNMSLKGPHLYKISHRYTGLVSSSGGGVVNQQIATNDPSTCTDWASLALLFDQYAVQYVTLTFVPKFNDAPPDASMGNFSTCIIRYDADTVAAPTSVDDGIQYDNYKFFTLNKIFRFRAKNKVQTDNSVNNAGMAATYDKQYGLLLDTNNVSNYQRGNIGWYGDGFHSSTNYADVIVDYLILFFSRR